MDFKNFRFGLLIRTTLMSTAIFIAIFSSYQHEWYVTTIVSIIISISLLVEIIRYAEKYKRGLSEFLISIKSRDFASLSSLISDSSTKDILHDAYKTIQNEFKNIRIDKEIQFHFLKTMIEHIKIALFSFDENGNIQFINKTASLLLNVKENHNIIKIKNADTKLYKLIKNLKSEENELIKLKINDTLQHLSVHATEIKTYNNTIKLISFQNIKQELEYQELESWQKLIRVLTHEIMNSVTPISSLSNAINETLDETKGDKNQLSNISDDDFTDIISSLKTIETRSKGLLKFVSSYKQLTRIPKPDIKEINLVELLNHCGTLLSQKIKECNIDYKLDTKSNTLKCFADYDLMEQVIINILINAIEAVKNVELPKLELKYLLMKTNNRSQFLIMEKELIPMN